MATMVKLKPSNQSLAARGLPVNPPVVKKRITKKKKVVNPARKENSEDSDKRQSCENGLDRCASLLSAMLEQPSGTVPKSVKVKKYHKRSSTPIDHFGKSKLAKLPTAVSRITDSQVSDTNTIDELIEEKELLQKYLNKIVHRSSEIEKQVQAVSREVLSDIDQNSDVTRDNIISPSNNNQKTQPKLSKENSRGNIPGNSFDCVPGNSYVNNDVDPNDNTLTNENCNNKKICEATKTVCSDNDSEKAAHPYEKNESDKSELFEILESITSKLKVCPDNLSTANADNCYPQKENENLVERDGPSIDTIVQLNPKKTAITAVLNNNPVDELQSRNNTLPNGVIEDVVVPVVDKISKVEHFIQNISIGKGEKHITDPRDIIFKTYKENLPSFLQVTLGKTSDESQNNRSIGESQNNSAFDCSNSYRNESTVLPSNESTVLPSNESTVLSSNDLHPEQTSIQLSTLEYLIKELKGKTMKQWNIEVEQIFTEIEHVVGSLSFLMSDNQTDSNKILHPLHLENADLKRKSQLLSECVDDLNETIIKLKGNETNVKSEEASVDLIIKTVQQKLGSEQRLKSEMNVELADLRKVNDELRKENSALVQSMANKEMKELEERQLYLKEKSSKDQEIALLHARIEELKVHRQADERERNILGLSLRQRDYEIERLSKLNSDLQESVSQLLADISDVKKIKGRETKFNCAMVTPVENSHISATNKCPPPIGGLDGRHINGPNNDESTGHEHAPLSPSSALPTLPTYRNYHENESESNFSTAVNNISENSVTAMSIKSKMSTLSETDFSLWSLATYDGAEFQRNIEHLDAEIKRIQDSIKR